MMFIYVIIRADYYLKLTTDTDVLTSVVIQKDK